jgi:hypothetical protein
MCTLDDGRNVLDKSVYGEGLLRGMDQHSNANGLQREIFREEHHMRLLWIEIVRAAPQVRANGCVRNRGGVPEQDHSLQFRVKY